MLRQAGGISCETRIRLLDPEGEPFMGIGTVWLLEGIDRLHSISAAAQEMELSYPKALRMMNSLEAVTGKQFLLRQKGGHSRGGAELTEFARAFLAGYRQLQEQAVESGRQLFVRHLQPLLEQKE